jgi:hypothetical protein
VGLRAGLDVGEKPRPRDFFLINRFLPSNKMEQVHRQGALNSLYSILGGQPPRGGSLSQASSIASLGRQYRLKQCTSRLVSGPR